MDDLHVFVFSPAWGLPTTGPFALKLLAWLAETGIAHRVVHENRTGRGPLGKSPWIEQGAFRLGDSDAIIRHLARQRGLDDPAAIASAQEARNDAIKTAFEERFHQILEWEMFLHPEGYAGMRRMVAQMAPPLVAGLVLASLRRHFGRQLRARGIARLTPEAIAETGARQIDGLVLCLEDGGGWLGGAGPVLADFAAWGQVAPMLAWPMDTPVARHAKAQPALADWHARIMARCFPAHALHDAA